VLSVRWQPTVCWTEELRNLEGCFGDLEKKLIMRLPVLYRVIILFGNSILYLRPLLHLAHGRCLEFLRKSRGNRQLSDKVMIAQHAVPVTDS
jgi:hypothetical protein